MKHYGTLWNIMKHYNIYYRNNKINNYPISEKELKDNIINNTDKFIYKKDIISNKINKINKNDIHIVECIVV